jgi:probable 2-oxoglutarate dehydrogenase E1 component DHKTD1
LIVIGPKILLRHPLAISSLSEMETGTHFFPVIPDTTIQHPEKVQRVLFVAGKFYYELYTQRAAKNLQEKVALVRIEELSPFPAAEIKEAISAYTQANDFVYVQEEPQNQGAYTFMEPRLNQIVPSKVKFKYFYLY